MVIMPSCTTPISSKMSVTANAIQRDMLVSWKVSGSTMAMAPTSTLPWRHRISASAPAPATRIALSTARMVPNAVIRRWPARKRPVW